jgi:hypothetical protein
VNITAVYHYGQSYLKGMFNAILKAFTLTGMPMAGGLLQRKSANDLRLPLA